MHYFVVGHKSSCIMLLHVMVYILLLIIFIILGECAYILNAITTAIL